jgi:hypothetical protein
MQSRAAMVFPVLPGKDAREIANELKSRPREYAESRKRLGITMERVYQQHTPMGDYVVVYFEADGDMIEKFAKVPSSDLDIDRYFVKAVKEIHGVDLTQPMQGPPPETVAEWSDPMARGRGQGMAFCMPIIPGQTERARSFARDAYGRDEFTASRRKLRGSREVATLNPTPHGDLIAVYVEGDDPQRGNADFASSQEPFDLWFKEQLTAIFPPQIDFTKPIEGVEEILDSAKIADLSVSKAA